MTVSVGMIDETASENDQLVPGNLGARAWMLMASPETIWKLSLEFLKTGNAKSHLNGLGVVLRYGHECGIMGRSKRTTMDVDALVTRWADTIALMSTAHTKDEADRQEASIDGCLTPILAAPIKQVREFATKLRLALEADKRIPYLVWRTYASWVDGIVVKASDDDVIALKTDLAKEIVTMVEKDIQEQLPDALVRALQWRSPENLEKAKQVIAREKEEGRPVRLRGRQSCLFLEAGGTEETPEVCVEI